VGVSTALEWCYSGRVFSAAEAKERGLVRSLHAPDELLPAARALAREIVDNTAPVSVALTRQMLWRMLGADHPMEAHRIDSRAVYARGQSADAREGVMSFLEKRAPAYPCTVSADMPDFYPWWPERPFT
jgi:enoyl-CoA hydratase/carnithine racemase